MAPEQGFEKGFEQGFEPRGEHPADHPGPMVFVDDLDAPELSAGDRHHLERVLRLRDGDALVLGDGRGRWCPSALSASLEPTAPVRAEPRNPQPLTVGFALVKSGKPEVIVQKLTELGIDRIAAFHAHRSVVRWDDDKAAKARARLETVAREAAMQCHRAWLPLIEAPVPLAELLGVSGAAMADRSGGPLAARHTTVLVGPEGGWAPEELAEGVEKGVEKATLGGHVLRAETAAIAAGALMSALRASGVGRST